MSARAKRLKPISLLNKSRGAGEAARNPLFSMTISAAISRAQ